MIERGSYELDVSMESADTPWRRLRSKLLSITEMLVKFKGP